MSLLSILEYSFLLHYAQNPSLMGMLLKDEEEALDFISRGKSNHMEFITVVGPENVYVKCSKGRTQDLPLEPEEPLESVKQKALILQSILIDTIRKQEQEN